MQKPGLFNRLPAVAVVAALALLAPPPAAAQQAAEPGRQNLENPSSEQWRDGSRIVVSGKVESVAGDDFVLDYGAGTLTVEVDDADSRRETRKLLGGQKVTVSGLVDRDLFENGTLEARAVYVEALKKYVYADPDDEEGGYLASRLATLTDRGDTVSIDGTVRRVEPDKNLLMLDTGVRAIAVDTQRLVDERTFEAGDRVAVSGRLDDADVFQGRRIAARSIVPLPSGG